MKAIRAELSAAIESTCIYSLTSVFVCERIGPFSAIWFLCLKEILDEEIFEGIDCADRKEEAEDEYQSCL